MLIRAVLAAALISIATPATAEPESINWPNYQEGDFNIKDYKFASGERLSQLKLHYRTLGSAERNAAGDIINGVLLLQGNTGTGANWLRPTLADELFKEGQPLDVRRYFIIIPDALGRGGSSKPSDGLKSSFPHYPYHDMVDSEHPVDIGRANHLRQSLRAAVARKPPLSRRSALQPRRQTPSSTWSYLPDCRREKVNGNSAAAASYGYVITKWPQHSEAK